MRVTSCFWLVLVSLLSTSCVNFPKPRPEQKVIAKSLKASRLKPEESVYVIAGKIHSDIVLPTQWLVENGAKIPEDLHDFRYLAFGWGDHVAYAERWGCFDLFNAFCWPSKSIVQVVGFQYSPRSVFPKDEVVQVKVPAARGAYVAEFINQSFVLKDDGSALTLRNSKWGKGYFIKSPYGYYYPRMCNQWVTNVLGAAGVETSKAHMFQSARGVVKQVKESGRAR